MIGGRRRWLFAALLLCVAGIAQADWRRDYEFGQQAMDKGNWSEAEKLMRSAQAEEPTAAAHKRFQGMQFMLYAPAHYAAVAAYKQGACARALEYLNDASTRAVTAQVPALASEQQDVERGCGNQVAAAPSTEPPRPAAPPPAPVGKPAATPVDTHTANAPPPAPKPAATPIVTAPIPAPPAAAPSERMTAPAALRAGISAFLAGDYDAAIRVNDAAIGDTRSRALLLLVRAAAGFTRAELKGGDAAMVAHAETDVRASHRLARIDPDPTLFSPKVRAQIARVR
jgi:tetratricopeptide (TPR) repeat protein